jgi:hypothetical protein
MSLELNYIVANNGQVTISNIGDVAQSATITTSGYPIQIIVTGDAEPSGSGWHELQIFRDSTPISEILHIETTTSGLNMTVSMSVIDTPVAGTYNYTVQIVNTSDMTARYSEVGQLFMSIEEKIISTRLSSNWLRRDINPPNVYYGYNNDINASDTDPSWSIRKVSTSGSVETVSWNDSSLSSFNAKWTERVENFIAPSGVLGFTYSGTYPITFTWNRLTGVNIYNIKVSQNGNYVYYTGSINPYQTNSDITATYYNTNIHDQYFQGSGTYEIVLEAINSAGSLTATYSYTL